MPSTLWLAGPLAVGAIIIGRLLPKAANPVPLANRLAYQLAAVVATALVALLALLAPEAGKGWAVVAGSLLGLVLTLATEWRRHPEPGATGARQAAVVLAAILLTLIWPEATVLSYALAAMAAVLAAGSGFAVLYTQTGLGIGEQAALALLALGSLTWLGEAHGAAAQATWLVSAGAVCAGLTAAAWAWPHSRWAPPLAAGAAGLLALAAMQASLPPFALGAALALGLACIPATVAGRSGTALLATVAGAAVLLLSLRLGGVEALAYTGLGLLGLSGLLPRHWATVLIGVAGARLVLQLFLSRTNLTTIGVDLTHTYGLVGLILGVFWPLAMATLYPRYRARRIVLLPFGWSMLAVPLLLAFLLHVEPLASFAMGLLAMTVTLGLMRYPQGAQTAADLSLPLLAVTLSTALIGAHWLVTVINISRGTRSLVMLGALALVFAFVLATKAQVRSTEVVNQD